MRAFLVVPLLLTLSIAQNPTFTHNRFTESGKTFSQDGTTIVKRCTSPEPPAGSPEDIRFMHWQETMMCAGFLEGVADLLSEEGSVCIPAQVEERGLEEVFLKYASNHEEMLHGPASRVIANAMKEEFGCRKP